jgi:hypothetical protein
VLFQHAAHRPICDTGSVREAAAAAAQRLGALLGQPLPELPNKPRLANAWIAENGHEPRPTLRDRRAVRAEEVLEFLIAADERAREAADAAWPHERKRTQDASRYHPLRLALRMDCRRPLELESPTRCSDGTLADKDRAGGGSLL